MAFRLPNGSTLDLAATYAATVTVTAITNAKPAKCTAVGHTLKAGDIVLLTSGWVKASGRAYRVGTVLTDTFELEGLDTTSLAKYPAGSAAGEVKKVMTWVNIPQITSIASSGGEQQFYTFGFLEENDDRQVPTTKSPSLLTLTVADDPQQPFVSIVEEVDETNEQTIQRLTLVNGDIILYNSIVSMTSTPSMTRNQLMENTVTLAQQGRPTRYRPVGA